MKTQGGHRAHPRSAAQVRYRGRESAARRDRSSRPRLRHREGGEARHHFRVDGHVRQRRSAGYQTGYAPCFAALGGLSSLVGYEGQPPSGMNVRYADSTFGTAAAYAAVVALMHRRKTGAGQFIDVSAVECMSSMIGDTIMDFALNGTVHECDGNRHPEMAPHGAYPCRGGRMDQHRRRLRQRLAGTRRRDGRSRRWRSDPRFKTHRDRKANEAELDRLIAAWTATRDARELAVELQQRGDRRRQESELGRSGRRPGSVGARLFPRGQRQRRAIANDRRPVLENVAGGRDQRCCTRLGRAQRVCARRDSRPVRRRATKAQSKPGLPASPACPQQALSVASARSCPGCSRSVRRAQPPGSPACTKCAWNRTKCVDCSAARNVELQRQDVLRLLDFDCERTRRDSGATKSASIDARSNGQWRNVSAVAGVTDDGNAVCVRRAQLSELPERLSRRQEPGVLPWRLFDRSRLGHRCSRGEEGGRLLLDHSPAIEDAAVLQALLVSHSGRRHRRHRALVRQARPSVCLAPVRLQRRESRRFRHHEIDDAVLHRMPDR